MKKILSLLLLFISISSLAQINYEAGYFINNNGIKTECLIRNLAWKDNPVEFEYKKNENDEPRKARIGEVTEFSIGNSYKFRRFTVNIDRSGNLIDNLSNKKAPEWQEETVLLKTLVEGDITLYQFEDNNLVRFFFSVAPYKTAEQLVFKEYVSDDSHVNENNYFRQQLYTTLKSPKLKTADFENLDYSRRDLVQLFLVYNNSDGKQFTDFQNKQNKSSFNLKVIAGVSMATINFSTSDDIPEPRDSESKKTAFRIGFEAELILPFNQNKWSLFLDPNYQAANSEGKINNWAVTIDFKAIELPMGIRHYMYLNNKSRIFIDAGYVLGFSLNSSIIYKTAYNDHPMEIGNSSNFFVGAGFSSGRYSIEARYNSRRELLPNYFSWRAQYEGISLTAGYKFL